MYHSVHIWYRSAMVVMHPDRNGEHDAATKQMMMTAFVQGASELFEKSCPEREGILSEPNSGVDCTVEVQVSCGGSCSSLADATGNCKRKLSIDDHEPSKKIAANVKRSCEVSLVSMQMNRKDDAKDSRLY